MVFIGTSGLLDMSVEEYGKYLNMVEINTTFYNIPRKEVFKNWYKNTSDNFRFAIKAPSFFTHKKKLLVDKEFKIIWKLFWSRCNILKEKLGYILFQLPSYLKFNDKFIKKLKSLKNFLPNHRYVFEFRNIEFYNDDIFKLFKQFKWTIATIFINNKTGWIKNMPYNKDFYGTDNKYIRLHGSKGQYIGGYNKIDFEQIRTMINKNSYIVFNNTDSDNDAFGDAIKLKNN